MRQEFLKCLTLKLKVMRKNYLLPNYFKRIGIVMFVPFLVLCIWLLAGPCEGDWFRINVPALFTLDLAQF